MSWDIVETTIKQQNPELVSHINWQEFDAALAIMFTPTNSGDLHMVVRNAKNINVKSHKTHIDLTSGRDIGQGLCPINDFFHPVGSATNYLTYMSSANLKLLGVNLGDDVPSFIESSIKVTKIAPRNNAQNASAQLTEKNDILLLRKVIDVGQSIILLRKKDSSLYAIGVNNTDSLVSAMKGKTKRMFLAERSEASDVVLEVQNVDSSEKTFVNEIELNVTEEDDDLGSESTQRGQVRVQNQELKKAIELRGMEVVNHYFNVHGFTTHGVFNPLLAQVQGLTKNPGYDILASNKISTHRIEVKATMSNGESVMLSVNELEAAIKDPKEVCLAVVSAIKVKVEEGKFIATGGKITLYRWKDTENVNKKLNDLTSYLDTFSSTGITLLKNSITCQVKIESAHLEEFSINIHQP